MVEIEGLGKPGSEEHQWVSRVNFDRLPRHIAIIMDGNGRWARERHRPRVVGHRAGIQSVRETVETAARLGLEVLTLYAFSQENWKRPRAEVSTLMSLLREYVRRELATLMDNDIRMQVIGRLDELPASARKEIDHALEVTRDNRGLVFNIALSYGGRTEILDACRALLRKGVEPDSVDFDCFAQHLYTAGQPDPDLLIRTSGELRVSNFLLWQIAYAEIWVTDTLWPDFRRKHLLQAIVEYQARERRYGGLSSNKSDTAAALDRR